ncbi:MAG: nucleotide exchange factor GrpE [Candidatus Heimdallarchaeota archaeon]
MDGSKKTKKSAADKPNDKTQSNKDENSAVVVLTGEDILSEVDNQYKTRYLYLQADFENYKKRMTKQMNDTIKWANVKLITSLLPVLDDFERVVDSGKNSTNIETLVSGMQMLLDGFKKTLNAAGLTEINSIGEKFDPNLHEAVEQVETLDQKEGTIVGELRKGYLFHNHCIRPSMVKVSVQPKEEIEEKSNKTEKG